MTATCQTRGDVAVITLANPPVNGLGYETRLGIVNGLEQALNDPAVKAIVITGAGKAFSGRRRHPRVRLRPRRLAEPNLLSVILALEASSKPHRRRDPQRLPWAAAGAGARLPLPRDGAGARSPAEVKIGLIPAPAARNACRACWAGERAEHDRQRRAGAQRTLARLPGQKLFDKLIEGELMDGASPSRRRSPTGARCRWCAT